MGTNIARLFAIIWGFGAILWLMGAALNGSIIKLTVGILYAVISYIYFTLSLENKDERS